MTINDQIKDEKLQYDINREAAKVSASSSGKIHKYEYLTGKDISNKQQIIEQAKFTYSPLGQAFEKQIKIVEDHGQKQVNTLESLKPEEQKKPTEDKSNNQPKAESIFDDLTNKRKKTMSELHDGVDYNNLKFEYVGRTNDASFYEYMDSRELFNAIRNSQIKFSEVNNKQNESLSKLSNIKIGKKAPEQKEVINNLETFYNSREEVINFFRDSIET